MGHPTREIDVTVKTLDAKRGVVRYVASDATIDSYGELIDPAGWKFDERWDANPVIPNSHQYGDVRDVLGRGIHREVTGNQLIIDVEFAINVPENDDARFVFNMVDQGFLRGCSVGFRPKRYAFSWGEPGKWADAVAYVSRKYNLQPAQIARLEGIYLEQQLSELSPCVLGANPSALAQVSKGLQSGKLSENDFKRLAGYMVARQPEKLSAVVQPPSESGRAPTVGDGAPTFARPADVALLRMFEGVAKGVPENRDILAAFARLAA